MKTHSKWRVAVAGLCLIAPLAAQAGRADAAADLYAATLRVHDVSSSTVALAPGSRGDLLIYRTRQSPDGSPPPSSLQTRLVNITVANIEAAPGYGADRLVTVLLTPDQVKAVKTMEGITMVLEIHGNSRGGGPPPVFKVAGSQWPITQPFAPGAHGAGDSGLTAGAVHRKIRSYGPEANLGFDPDLPAGTVHRGRFVFYEIDERMPRLMTWGLLALWVLLLYAGLLHCVRLSRKVKLRRRHCDVRSVSWGR